MNYKNLEVMVSFDERGAYHAIKSMLHPNSAGFYNLRTLVVPIWILNKDINPGDYLIVRSEAFRLNDFLHDLGFMVSKAEKILHEDFYDIPVLPGKGNKANVIQVQNNFIDRIKTSV